MPILGVRGVFAGWDLHQSKGHTRFPNTCQYKIVLYQSPAGRNSYVQLCPPPQFCPHVWRLGYTKGSKIVPIEISSPHSYSTSIRTKGLSYTV